MSWPEAIASAAWPIATAVIVVTLVIIFRKELKRFFAGRKVTRVKAGPFEAEWSESVAKVEQATAAAPATSAAPSELPRAPARAVLHGYNSLETEIANLLSASGVEDVDPEVGAVELARWAHAAGLIEERSISAVEGVTVLRDLALTRPERVGAAEADEYKALIAAILYSIRHARRPGM